MVLVGVVLPQQSEEEVESSLHELSLLTDTAQGKAISTILQNRDRVDSATYVGKGKLEEIKAVVDELGCTAVIFNGELSPSQQRNLERVLDVKVLDRTQLILDIFAGRARSREGQLQVELAQYRYLLPRIGGQGTSLSRLGGGIGTRGPGETKLETDRRHIRRRMKEIEQALSKIVAHRERYRERRKKNQLFQVALVGYTNAGKSTLLNKLTQADTYVQDQLFATLDPTSKRVKYPTGLELVVTDTVGFIRDLPTSLVAAFRSTLEEVLEADLILHVINSASPTVIKEIEVVEKILQELGAADIPTIKVYNKRDKLPVEPLFIHEEDYYISALNDQDIEALLKRLLKYWKQTMSRFTFRVAPEKAAEALAFCRENGLIEHQDWLETEGIYDLVVYLPKTVALTPQLAAALKEKHDQAGLATNEED